MGRATLRILEVTLTAVSGLLIIPVTVNVGTGGAAPGWLRPYVSWLWPVAITCVVLVIALEVWDKVRPSAGTISARRPHDPRNIGLALAQVARYVEGRQRGSLAERVRLALALDERPLAVRQPAHLVQRVSGEEFQLSADLGIADVFDQMSESMLILGAPGAGKTTQLLDLAAALVMRARLPGRRTQGRPGRRTSRRSRWLWTSPTGRAPGCDGSRCSAGPNEDPATSSPGCWPVCGSGTASPRRSAGRGCARTGSRCCWTGSTRYARPTANGAWRRSTTCGCGGGRPGWPCAAARPTTTGSPRGCGCRAPW